MNPTSPIKADAARAAPLRKARKLASLLGRPRYRYALLRGVAAAVEHAKVPFPHPYRTVIDVGANRGQFAVFALERFPGARLLCVEPLPAGMIRLRRAVGHDADVAVLPFAAGEAAGEAPLYVAASDDSSSLLPVGPRASEAFGTSVIGTQTVAVRPLDAEISGESLEPPTLLKIDVQGAEYETLVGARGLLPAVDSVLVECSFAEFYAGQRLADDIVCYLKDAGYAWLGSYGEVHDGRGRLLQADLLFDRRAR